MDALDALADARRRRIVELLADGERCVCDISDALDISNALASHHLKKLREAGLVVTERRGSWLHCRLDPAVFASLAQALGELASRGSLAAERTCCCSTEGARDDG